jgi:tripartite-type tricarboxylate transporter receptor subunit TctC
MLQHFRTLLAGAFLSLISQLACAQDFPTRPLRILVPYPAGGVVDLLARAVNEKLAADLGQPVIVEARPGANGSIATDAVAKSVPDGHTLLLAAFSHAINPSLSRVPWHPVQDFAGVAMMGETVLMVAVTPSLPVKTVPELIAHAKARPGELNYVQPGKGTPVHVSTELFMKQTGVKLTAVSYRGIPPALMDFINGHLHLGFFPVGQIAPHVESGKARALAVLGPTRLKKFPEVPTMAELGFEPSQVARPWFVFLVPKRTPRFVVDRLHAGIAKTIADPDVKAAIERLGNVVLPPDTPQGVDQFLASEFERWQKFIAETGLALEPEQN